MAVLPQQVPVRDFNRPVTFAAAIGANIVVCYSAAGTVDVPGAANALPAGVTENAYASGATGEIITAGTVRLIAGEAIAVDDLIVIHNTSGHVGKAGASVPLVGRALTAQSTVGSYVTVELHIGSYSPAGYGS